MTTTAQPIAIYGCGGFGREVAWLLETQTPANNYQIIGFVDDNPANIGKTLNDHPVLSLDQIMGDHPTISFALAVGNPQARERLAQSLTGKAVTFPTLLHHNVEKSSFVSIGTGSIICANTTLTVNIVIKQHVHINLHCTIGHDVVIGAYTTLSPGVCISGNVHIGKKVYIGAGATIINGTPDAPLIIGDGTVIGAGACVTRSTEPHALYVGVPAVKKKSYATA